MPKPTKPAKSIGVRHVISFDELDAELSKRLGFEVKWYTSQSGVQYSHGYSRVWFAGKNYQSFDTVQARKEGDDKDEYDYPLKLVLTDAPDWYEQMVAWVTDILSAGRTVECGAGVGVELFRRPWAEHAQSCYYMLESIVNWIDGNNKDHDVLNLNPDYQRSHSWTDQQAERFVGHWLEGGDTPKFYIQRYSSAQNSPRREYWLVPAEVIDGQQRLRALYRWYKGEIAAEISDGRRMWYRDTNEIERRGFNIQLHFVDLPRLQRLEFYVRLNRGGTVHKDEEIQRVRDLISKGKSNTSKES